MNPCGRVRIVGTALNLMRKRQGSCLPYSLIKGLDVDHTTVLNFILAHSCVADSGANESRVFHLEACCTTYEVKARLVKSEPIEYEIDSVVILQEG